jgi:phosphatidate phosphatase APP1
MWTMTHLRHVAARRVAAAEVSLDARLVAVLSRRPGWELTVVPYVGHGTATRAHVRARVVLRRRTRVQRSGRAGVVLTALAHYLSVDVPGEEVTVAVAGAAVRAVAGREGYVEATLPLAGAAAGWHPVHFTLAATGGTAEGRLLVVDPAARLGVVSDLDDTVIHTGLTRLAEAVRTTVFVAAEERIPIAGAAAFYRALVDSDGGRAPVFYVSTGAWNLHAMLEGFLARHDFPVGPLLLTDWGPGGTWLFRERSEAVKVRIIEGLLAEHPQLLWVLVGDSGQDDPQAYAAVARAHPGRIHAVYIREVPPQSPERTRRIRGLVRELAGLGVPMLLVADSVDAAEHAHRHGRLIDTDQLSLVRASTTGGVGLNRG